MSTDGSDTRSERDSLEARLLFAMKRIRAVEETIARRYSEWNMRCPTHLSIGQEAVGAAVGAALARDDFVVSGHRAHAHYLGKGGSLEKMIAELYGRATGCSRGFGGSMHLIDQDCGFMGSTAIVANTIPVGVGLALSAVLHKTNQIACVYLGDGAVEEGVFYESVNFAVVRCLPVLFICENNLYSVYSPLKVRQPASRNIHEMVGAMGIASHAGDGNDALEVYEKVSEAVESIRSGTGPVFFELATYRWLEHCGPNNDDHLGYRSESEIQTWTNRDPIASLEGKLTGSGALSDAGLAEMSSEIDEEIRAAFAFAETSPVSTFDVVGLGEYKE